MTSEEIKARDTEYLASAYSTVFRAPGSDLVLRDLIEFCCAAITTVDSVGDLRHVLVREGRRQVFLRMNEFIALNIEEIIKLRAGRPRILEDNE